MLPTTMLRAFPYVAVAMGVLCAIVDARFAYQIGSLKGQVDGFLLAGIAIIVNCMILGAATFAGLHFRRRAYVRGLIAFCLWVIALSASFVSHVGYFAISREHGARHTTAESQLFADRQEQLAHAEDRLKALTKRNAHRIRADLDILRLDRRWPKSGCEEVSSRSQVKLCIRAVELEAELNEALEAERLRASIEQWKRETAAGPPLSKDPAASLISRRLHLSLEDAQLLIALIFTVVSLAISGLGTVALLLDEDPKTEPKEPEKPIEAVRVTVEPPPTSTAPAIEEAPLKALPKKRVQPQFRLPSRW